MCQCPLSLMFSSFHLLLQCLPRDRVIRFVRDWIWECVYPEVRGWPFRFNIHHFSPAVSLDIYDLSHFDSLSTQNPANQASRQSRLHSTFLGHSINISSPAYKIPWLHIFLLHITPAVLHEASTPTPLTWLLWPRFCNRSPCSWTLTGVSEASQADFLVRFRRSFRRHPIPSPRCSCRLH